MEYKKLNNCECYGKTVAQVALKFLIQNGIIIIPKTTHKERMQEIIELFDFTLSDEDLRQIRLLDIGWNITGWPSLSNTIRKAFDRERQLSDKSEYMEKIKIHVLRTGEVRVSPYLPFGGDDCSLLKASGITTPKSFTSNFFIEEADTWRDEAHLMIHRQSDLHFYMVTKCAEIDFKR